MTKKEMRERHERILRLLNRMKDYTQENMLKIPPSEIYDSWRTQEKAVVRAYETALDIIHQRNGWEPQ